MSLKLCAKGFKGAAVAVLTFVFFAASLTVWMADARGAENSYPDKPIKVVVPMAPGGPVDVGARIMMEELSKELGVTMSVEYKPGAGGVTGSAYVAVAKPDGYTLLCAASGTIVGSPVVEKTPYNPLTDFTPIAYFGIAPNVLVVDSASKFKTFDDLVKYVKEKPGDVTCNTSGIGTTSHLLLELMKMNGINITHVPAKGAAPSLTNLLGKHVDSAMVLYPPVIPYVRAGQLRILVTTNKIPQEPNIPTVAEKGMPEGAALGVWEGFLAPPNLPKPILDRLASAFAKVSKLQTVAAALQRSGFTAEYLGPDGFKKRIENDYRVMQKIGKAAGLGK